jgi:hypothetical protein
MLPMHEMFCITKLIIIFETSRPTEPKVKSQQQDASYRLTNIEADSVSLCPTTVSGAGLNELSPNATADRVKALTFY